MHRATAQDSWQGRVDSEEGPLALRWHQRMRVADGPPVAGERVLVGFACDAGVARNQGRIGAAEGPGALRHALAGLAWHGGDIAVVDHGDIVCSGDELEQAQRQLGLLVAEALRAGARPIVLGGGHEVAFGSFQGLVAALPPSTRLGIINVDAHFDLRAGSRGSSGTPFRQIAEALAAVGRPFHYLCIGVARSSNTQALYERARVLGVRYWPDRECQITDWPLRREDLHGFLAQVDRVQLSLCLDALPAALSPGVSAPAAAGIALEFVERVIDEVRDSGKLALAEVAELNPRFDPDGRTARLAARLVASLIA